MSQLVPQPIKTFSVAFDDPDANELPYARTVAQTLGTDHHEVLVRPVDFADALPHLVWHEDEPIGHSASVPLYFVSQLAQRYVKVVLTGEGSDELLAGYYRYRTTLLNMSVGRWYHRFSTERMRHMLRDIAAIMAPQSLKRRLPRTFLWRTPDLDSLYCDNFAVFPRQMQDELLTDSVKDRLNLVNPYAAITRYLDLPRSASVLQRLLYADLKTYLHELLMKQDQMSMAASIESRVPFLDHKLVEFSVALPDQMKLHRWTTKYVLREAMKGILPQAILNRPKMGFPVPIGRWFRSVWRPMVEDLVLGERATARGLFRRAFLERLMQEHMTGARDHTERIWALTNFEIWQRTFLDAAPPRGCLPQLEEAPRAR